MTHICVSKLTSIGSDNGLSPGRRQAINWTNAGILIIGPLGTNFSEILIEILPLSFMKMHLKVSYAKWRLFCLGLNVFNKLCSREFGRSTLRTRQFLLLLPGSSSHSSMSIGPTMYLCILRLRFWHIRIFLQRIWLTNRIFPCGFLLSALLNIAKQQDVTWDPITSKIYFVVLKVRDIRT